MFLREQNANRRIPNPNVGTWSNAEPVIRTLFGRVSFEEIVNVCVIVNSFSSLKQNHGSSGSYNSNA